MKKIKLFLIMIILFMFTAAPSYRNWTANDVLMTGVGPKNNQDIKFKAYSNTNLNFYVSVTNAVTLTSHTTQPPPLWPFKEVYHGAISANHVTVTTRYKNISVYNNSGSMCYVWANGITSTAKRVAIPNAVFWIFDNTLSNIGTLHTSGVGTGNIIIQEYN